MKQFITCLSMVLYLLFSSATQAQVVLNEIYANPGSGKHEFFELYNTSTSITPLPLDGYTILSYFEEGTKKGFYVLDLPDLTIGPKSHFVGSSAQPFNYQSTLNSTATNFSWNDPTLNLKYGYLQKWVAGGTNLTDGNMNYDLEALPSNFNDFFSERIGNGASYNAFVYKNGVLINTFFGGTGGSHTMPEFIFTMPALKLNSVTETGTNVFTINFISYVTTPVEYVNQNIGTDNGYIRLKDAVCGTWTKSSALVNHTPQRPNGTAIGTIGELSVLAYIKRGATAGDSSLIVYDVVGGTPNAFPVEKQLYIDNGSVPGELDGNDEFLASAIETSILSPADSTKFLPFDADIILIAKSALGCLDQVVIVVDIKSIFSLLPVKLISFTGAAKNNKAELQWSVTGNETANRFEVQKSADGINFKNTTVVLATAKSGQEQYIFSEAAERESFYRLKIVGKNGQIQYSKVIAVTNSSDKIQSSVQVLNASSGQQILSYTTMGSSETKVSIYDLMGKRIHTQTIRCQKGNNIINLSAIDLQLNSVYVVEVLNNAERATTKFIKSNTK